MVNKLLPVLLIPFLSSYAVSQDTILVNSVNTVYMIFPEAIDLIDIGVPDQYYQQIKNDALFIKSQSDTSPVSTLLVRYGKDYRFLYVQGSDSVKEFYYDFRKNYHNKATKSQGKENYTVNEQQEANNLDEKETEDVNNQQVRKKVEMVKEMKNEYKSLGVITSNLIAAVQVIRNDEKYTYLKIVIKNKSSIEYSLDFISFQYIQLMKKGFLKKKKKNIKDVFPKMEPVAQVVPAKSTKVLGYAIPIFALSNNGYLLIAFREKKGDRVLKIKVESDVIQKSKVIEDV